jgi:hypothetical protein
MHELHLFIAHFPNYFRFCFHLHNLGVNVLGLADEPYDLLNFELKPVLQNITKFSTCIIMTS